MTLEIYNYNCISELKYTIQDEKIKFLFGISGSSKSSIANALTKILIFLFVNPLPYSSL